MTTEQTNKQRLAILDEAFEQNDLAVIQLVGEDGNAFAILAEAQAALRIAGWSHVQIEAFMEEAMSGDYDHLLQTCLGYLEVE